MDRYVTGASIGRDETISRVARYHWVERRLFEVLGGWVQGVPEPDAKLCLDVHSRQHAWHSQLWEQRLVELGEDDPAGSSEPGEALAKFMDVLVSTSETTLDKLVGTYRVLIPRKVAAYEKHLAGSSSVSDGPVMRSLRLALTDEIQGWREGDALVQSLLGSEDDVHRAAAHQARLEAVLVGGCDVPGEGTPFLE